MDRSRLEQVLRQVAETDGFAVEGGKGYMVVTNEATGEYIRLTLRGTARTNSSHYGNILRIGWRPELWELQHPTGAPEVPDEHAGWMFRLEDSVDQLGPAEAEKMLETIRTEANGQGRGQRLLDRKSVADYAHIMRLGDWLLSPDPIAFDWDGHLINGMHRLQAIMKSGKTEWFKVTRGWDPAVFHAMDKGRKRKVADTMYVEGWDQTPALNKATLLLHRVKQTPFTEAWNKIRPTEGQQMRTLNEHPELAKHVRWGAGKMAKGLHRNSLIVARYLCVEASHHDEDYGPAEWFHNFRGGYNLKEGSPAAVVRDYLTAEETAGRTKGNEAPKQDLALYLILKAWNNTVEANPMSRVSPRFPLVIEEALPWPQPAGYVLPRQREAMEAVQR